MRKLVALFLCTICLCACGSGKGSLKDGDYHDDKWIAEINEKINRQEWQMALLNDLNIDEDTLNSMYHLKADDVASYVVHTSILSTNPEEIAIFQSKDGSFDKIQEAIRFHMEELKSKYEMFPAYIEMIDSHIESQIGDYYIVIISEDAQKIFDYLSS